MQIDRGYISPYFVTNAERMEAIIEDPYILITDKKISAITDILPLLEKLVQVSTNIVVVAEDVDGEALATLVVNKLRGTLNVVAVRAPGFGDRRKAMLEDIAILTGGKVISEELGRKLDSVTIQDLGRARKVTANTDETSFVEGRGAQDAIMSRVKQIKAQIEETTSDFDKEKLNERLTNLGGGAVIKVGAGTESRGSTATLPSLTLVGYSPSMDDQRRRTADTVALLFVLAVLVFGFALLFLPGFAASLDRLSGGDAGSDTTTVTRTISEEADGVAKRTETIETKTTPDTSALGRALTVPGLLTLFRIGLVVLAAFLAGAFVQRVVLGKYAIELPFLKFSDVTADVVATTLADFRRRVPPPVRDGGGGGFGLTAPDRAFEGVDDPKVAMIDLRLEIERRLRTLAELQGAEPGPPSAMLSRLTESKVLSQPAAAALGKLIELGAAATSARVEYAVLAAVREQGPDILQRLDGLLAGYVPQEGVQQVTVRGIAHQEQGGVHTASAGLGTEIDSRDANEDEGEQRGASH